MMKMIVGLGIFHSASLFVIADSQNYLDGFFIYYLQDSSFGPFSTVDEAEAGNINFVLLRSSG